jgi:hypothetical protein
MALGVVLEGDNQIVHPITNHLKGSNEFGIIVAKNGMPRGQ